MPLGMDAKRGMLKRELRAGPPACQVQVPDLVVEIHQLLLHGCHIDVHAGGRLRAARLLAGMLGSKLCL